MPNVFAFTFARGGSKGVPRKNVRLLGGKPLIGWAIDLSRELPFVAAHYVSTDDDEIAAVGKRFGANIIQRPSELASDTASEWLAWQHAVAHLIDQGLAAKEDVFLSLPATAPLRTLADIQGAYQQYVDNGLDILVTATDAQRNPYFNMLKPSVHGGFELVCQGEAHRRQDAPECYDMTTVCYITTFGFIQSATGVLDGRVDMYRVSPRSAVDIDTEQDFRLAEFYLTEPL